MIWIGLIASEALIAVERCETLSTGKLPFPWGSYNTYSFGESKSIKYLYLENFQFIHFNLICFYPYKLTDLYYDEL